MGCSMSVQRDVWIVIYEKGIREAKKVQRQALKLSMQGKLSGQGTTPASVNSGAHPNSNSVGALIHPLLPGLAPRGAGVGGASAEHAINHGGFLAHESLSSSSSDSASPDDRSYSWTGAPLSSPASVQDRFSAILRFVDAEWSERDRADLRNVTTKLWKQYHDPAHGTLHPDELACLTKDSLETLASHISLFINNSYEEMKKYTQICMINLLQRYRMVSAGQGPPVMLSLGSNPSAPSPAAGAAQMPVQPAASSPPTSSSAAVSAPSSSLPSQGGLASALNPTMSLSDIEWLNQAIETEKRGIMQVLQCQIEEWSEHYADVAEALFQKMDPHNTGKITQKMFIDSFGTAIYEVVGPQFFSHHMPSRHTEAD